MTASVRQENPGVWNAAVDSTYTTTALSISALVGSTIEVYVVWNGDGSNNISSVVDSASQAYTLRSNSYDASSNLLLSVFTFFNNASNTALTVTVNFVTAYSYRGVWVKEITGVETSGYQNSGANFQNLPGAGTNSITSGSITLSAQPALLSSVALSNLNNNSSFSAGTGFTAGVTGFALSGTPAGYSESLRLTSTAAVAATYTDTAGAVNDYLVGAVIYTESGAGPPPVLVASSGLQSFVDITAGTYTYTTWSVASGNTLVLLYDSVDDNHNGAGIASVADGQGSWTSDEGFTAGTHYKMGSYSLQNTNSGTHAVVMTMNASAAAYGQFVVLELLGVWTFDALLGSATAGSTTPSVTGTAPAANDLQFALYLGDTANNEPPSIPSGWSGADMGIPASGWPSAGFAFVQSSLAQGATSWGTLGLTDTWGCIIVGYSPPVTGLSLTASVGDFVLTGENASFTISQVISLTMLASPGAFDWVGAFPYSNYNMIANNGAFTQTGQSASFTINLGELVFPAPAGFFTLTGKAATFVAGNYVFPAFTGVFTLNGQPVSFTFSTSSQIYPNLLGMDYYDAVEILVALGLQVAMPILKNVSRQVALPGIVIGQSVLSGTPLVLNTPVTLTVATAGLLSVSDNSPSAI